MKNNLYRILDANYNRTKEALRVLEDLFRFHWNDPRLSKRLKRLRHSVSRQMISLPIPYKKLIRSRDSVSDVGRNGRIQDKAGKTSLEDLVTANFKRSEESVRVLEEVLKAVDIRLSDYMRHLRFELYALEKETFRKL